MTPPRNASGIVAFSLGAKHKALLADLVPEPRQRSAWLRQQIERAHEHAFNQLSIQSRRKASTTRGKTK